MRILLWFFAVLAVFIYLGGLLVDSRISAGLIAAICFTVFLVAAYSYFNSFN